MLFKVYQNNIEYRNGFCISWFHKSNDVKMGQLDPISNETNQWQCVRLAACTNRKFACFQGQWRLSARGPITQILWTPTLSTGIS